MDHNTAIFVAAGNISANSLSAQIDNREGGVISGVGLIATQMSLTTRQLRSTVATVPRPARF
jgi:hypothetical protein